MKRCGSIYCADARRRDTITVAKQLGRPACIRKGLGCVAAQQAVENVSILGNRWNRMGKPCLITFMQINKL